MNISKDIYCFYYLIYALYAPRPPDSGPSTSHSAPPIMDSSKHFASKVAPYAPPPDQLPEPSSNGTNHPRASWFQKPASFVNAAVGGAGAGAYGSYQSGAIPTFGGGEQTGITGFGGQDEEHGVTNLWETRFGWRVDIEAAVAYLFGPVSGMSLL
jgi:hypothetical protein